MSSRSTHIDVHMVFREFADGTTMHGVPRIIHARSLPARVFWSIICLGAFIMFLWQCGILLARYYSYPKKVNVEIVQRPIPFPDVTVCNTDFLDLEAVEIINKMLAETLQPMESPVNYNEADLDNSNTHSESFPTKNSSGESTPSRNSSGIKYEGFKKKYNDFWDLSIDIFGTLYQQLKLPRGKDYQDQLEVSSRLGFVANLGSELASQAGIQLNDFIAHCRFMNEDCNVTAESFSKYFDPYYFNCFTFRPGSLLGRNKRATRLKGFEYGLSLLLFTGSAGKIVDPYAGQIKMVIPGLEESNPALASSRGTRVLVHPPDTMPHPAADGYDVPPGFSVTIGVKARENVRIKYPHGNCSDEGGDNQLNSTFRYTLMQCQNSCIQRTIMEKCGCLDNRISTHEDTKNLTFCFQLPLVPLTCQIAVGGAGGLEGMSLNNKKDKDGKDYDDGKTGDLSMDKRNRGNWPSNSNAGSPIVSEGKQGTFTNAQTPKYWAFDAMFPLAPVSAQKCLNIVQKWADMLQCRKDVYENMTVREPETMDKICNCYPPCNDMQYDTSYSLSMLPENTNEHSSFYGIIEKFLKQGLSKSKRDIFKVRSNKNENWTTHYGSDAFISRLNVHISDSNIIKTTESPDYEAIRLVSDIGGQLGLWIGISVMTLFEVLQLIADVFRFLTAKGRHVGEKRSKASSKVAYYHYVNGQEKFQTSSILDVGMNYQVERLTTV